MTITETGRGYEIVFDYRPAIVRELKEMAGFRFQGKARGWFIPISGKKKMPDGVIIENFQNRPLMEKFKAKHKVNADGFDAVEQIFKINDLPELTIELPWRKGVTPYAYQNNGIARGLELERFINADQPGLGKSMQAIGTILGFEKQGKSPFPCLIICPATLKENWRREIEDKFSSKRAIILSDKNRANWHSLARMGMGDFVITNYESLWSFFVTGRTDKKKTGCPKLSEMIFDPRKDLFRSVVIDEAHKCFIYETPILTNKGWLPIGYICENKIPDLYALSCDLSTNVVSLKKITNYWINDLQDREIYKITTSAGTIYCTGNHRIYTPCGQKEALCLLCGEKLFALRGDFYSYKEGESNPHALLSAMHHRSGTEIAGIQSEVKSVRLPGSRYRQGLCSLWKGVSCKWKRTSQKNNSFLLSKLLGKMENVSARNKSTCRNPGTEGEGQTVCYNTNGQTGKKKTSFGFNEDKQSDGESRLSRPRDGQPSRKNIFKSGWKRPTYRASKNVMEGVTSSSRKYGMGDKNTPRLGAISKFAKSLQGRYSYTRTNVGYRSGWEQPQNQKMEIFGPSKNGNIECVRVESCEVYQPRSAGDIGFSSVKSQRVYDIEVEDNHNYFANGILVSNCKDATTRQAKVLKGLTSGKEIIIALTGTPVVNKPKDLLSQLAIINQLHRFGGWKYFNDRYCQGGSGAAFLNELNGKLNNICFFRREKKDVLKDLPDKMREIITCDITTREEYNLAKNNFMAFLRQQGYSQGQIDKSLRAEVMVQIQKLKEISGRGKLPEVIEQIQEMVDADQKVVVFIYQKYMANALQREFPRSVCVRGTEINPDTGKETPQSAKARQLAVDQFQSCGRCGVNQTDHDKCDHDFVNNDVNPIICSLGTGGVGLTLTAASTLLLVELPWHPAQVEQIEDRIHRIGQKDGALIKTFLGKDTIDEKIYYEVIVPKREVSDAITGTVTSIDTIITDLTKSLFNQR